jgi:hypothetical protein
MQAEYAVPVGANQLDNTLFAEFRERQRRKL